MQNIAKLQLQQLADELTAAHIIEARSEIELIFMHVLQLNRRTELLMVKELTIAQQSEIRYLVDLRKTRMPLSQVLGQRDFWESTFIVNNSVLTPRKETELLIEEAKKLFDAQAEISILDLGTGSGCIAITAAQVFPNAKILAVDISKEALVVAHLNAQKLIVDERISFLHSNWCENLPTDSKFDLIFSNPPYIALTEMESLMPEVKDYEPHLALTDYADGLQHYRTLAAQLRLYLGNPGYALLEFGYLQTEGILDIFKEYDIKIVKDLSGHDRCLILYS